MLGRFKRQEEVWEPVSEWGRAMKPYLDQVKRDAVIVMKPRPKAKVKRIRVRKPRAKTGNPCGRPKNLAFISDRKCSECETYIRADNEKGLCQKHAKQAWNLSMKGKRGKKAA